MTSESPKEKLNELNKRLTESTWPSTKKQKGYKGYLALSNPQTGERIVITLWDTEADMLASEKASYFTQVTSQANLAASDTKITGPKHFAVIIQD